MKLKWFLVRVWIEMRQKSYPRKDRKKGLKEKSEKRRRGSFRSSSSGERQGRAKASLLLFLRTHRPQSTGPSPMKKEGTIAVTCLSRIGVINMQKEAPTALAPRRKG